MIFFKGCGSVLNKIDAFPKYATRQAIAKFITKYEFKQIIDVNGSIVEAGVYTVEERSLGQNYRQFWNQQITLGK